MGFPADQGYSVMNWIIALTWTSAMIYLSLENPGIAEPTAL